MHDEMTGKKFLVDPTKKVTPDTLGESAKMFKENFSDIFIEQVQLGNIDEWLKKKISTYTTTFNAYALYGQLKDDPTAKSFICFSIVEPIAQHLLNSCVAANEVKPDFELMLQYAVEDVTKLRQELQEKTIKAEMLEDQVNFLKEELDKSRKKVS